MIGWIMHLFMSGNTSININGEVAPHYWSSCGVRQGAQFPLLFNSAIDSLAEILDKTNVVDGICGVVGKLMTHLQYAYDTFIIVEEWGLDVINLKLLLLVLRPCLGIKFD